MNTSLIIRQDNPLNTLYWDKLRETKTAKRWIVRFIGRKWYHNEYVGTVWAQSAVSALRKAKSLISDIPLHAVRHAMSLEAVPA